VEPNNQRHINTIHCISSTRNSVCN